MRPIGFSTGALAKSDFRGALDMLKRTQTDAVELSALRLHELEPLVNAVGDLDLSQFRYVSFHVPSSFGAADERRVIDLLLGLKGFRWPLILHPDAIHDFDRWAEFGDLLCIENTDKRKDIGRFANELQTIFEKLPEAALCMDIAHARQVDPTMTETYLILKSLGGRLRQLHISEVTTNSRHDGLSLGAVAAVKNVAYLVPPDTPVIIESPVTEPEIANEIARALDSLTPESATALP